ncbi:MAG: SDR family NAD(P)-dependent oxidoreductase [Xanthomonadales bacterium]|nr:SDR family NAD(P)-dependent oxidoreductase [Xanthomonadales bacterium]MDH4018954.1 SDR family NAD(P)-dependent oxidoreductase [Xanthomonadales bacterium]
MDLSGKTVLITGAAGGLGSALAQQCADLGAELILLDKDRRGLGELSDRMTDQGLNPPGLYPLNLAAAGVAEFDDLANTINSEFKGLDALVHCAVDFDSLQPFEQIQPQDWLQSMQVNVNAPWLLSCTLLPLLKRSENAHLLFMLDDLDAVSDAFWGAYGAGKAALTGIVRQFDAALSHSPVTVHGVIPGPMRTGFRARVYHAENPMEQPDPAIVASKITEILTCNIPDRDLILNFSV